MHDVVEATTISLIPRPATSPPSEQVPWRIGWGDQFNLFVSFGSTVKVIIIIIIIIKRLFVFKLKQTHTIL